MDFTRSILDPNAVDLSVIRHNRPVLNGTIQNYPEDYLQRRWRGDMGSKSALMMSFDGEDYLGV